MTSRGIGKSLQLRTLTSLTTHSTQSLEPSKHDRGSQGRFRPVTDAVLIRISLLSAPFVSEDLLRSFTPGSEAKLTAAAHLSSLAPDEGFHILALSPASVSLRKWDLLQPHLLWEDVNIPLT